MMEELAKRMTGRIWMAMAGTSSQRERERVGELSQTYLRNHFNGSMMREICIMHSLDKNVMIPLQTHLGIALRAGVNQSELARILLMFQIVPDEEVARKFLLNVEEQANLVRIERACEWGEHGDGWSIRMDNADVGKLLHFVALIATRDRAPPAPPFPFASATAFNPGAATWSSPSRSTTPRSFQQLTLKQFGLSTIEAEAETAWWQLFHFQPIVTATAVRGAQLTHKDLLRRTRFGLFNSTADGARALGLQLEVEVLGPAPTAPAIPLPPTPLPPHVGGASEADAQIYYHYDEADDGTVAGDIVENPIIGTLVAKECLDPNGGTYLGLFKAGALHCSSGEGEAQTVSWCAAGSDVISLCFDFIVASCNPKLMSWPGGGAIFASEEDHHQRVGFFVFSVSPWKSAAALFGVSTGTAQHIGDGEASAGTLVSGESGNGKTETNRLLIQALSQSWGGTTAASPESPSRSGCQTAAVAQQPTQHQQGRAPLISPPRRTVLACCDYTPSPHFPFNGLEVRKGESLTMIGVETSQDLVCLARSECGQGMLPTYVIGQGEMVQPEERERWEMAIVEAAHVDPPPNRMERAHSLLLQPGAEGEGARLNLNREGAHNGQWTERDAARRRGDGDGDEDYLPTEPFSGSEPGSDCDDDDGLAAATSGGGQAASEKLPAPRHRVCGKYDKDLLYMAPVLQNASEAGVTQVAMAYGRILNDEVRIAAPATWAKMSKAQRTSSYSADQAFHEKEWSRREWLLKSLVQELLQRQSILASPSLNATICGTLERDCQRLKRRMADVFAEPFHLGIMHAVIYLQRSAFQMAEDLLWQLIASAMPELERVKVHIVQVKEGYWLLVHLLFGRCLQAWRAYVDLLCARFECTIGELRKRSRKFAIFEFVMVKLVAPSVMLADGSRGRTIAGKLKPIDAWPLVLAGLKLGLRLLLLSGRHHLYCVCFGREIRAILLFSEEQFAWWANNLWVRVGTQNYFNDETVERFLIKVLKRDMEGGHFTEREAVRSAATVEAVQMIRRELHQMAGGVKKPDNPDQASTEHRKLLQQPGVPAALMAVLEEKLVPWIKLEFDFHHQVEVMTQLSSASPEWRAAQLSRYFGVTDIDGLRAQLASPLQNPFTGEEMQNTDVAKLDAEAEDRLQRHVVGNYLNADKGFRYREPTCLQKKESPIIIGPVPRKVVLSNKKVLKESQQSKWALKKAGVEIGSWDVASPQKHVLFDQCKIWVTALNVAKSKAWPALVEVFKLKPWSLGNGQSLGLPLLERGIRRNAMLRHDGSCEVACEAFGVDAFADVRFLQDAPTNRDGKRTGVEEIYHALLSRLRSLFDSFERGYYPFDAGDLNPYKWITFYARAAEAFAKLPSDQQSLLVRTEGKVHTSDFQLGVVSTGLKAALCDKFTGGREAGLKAIGNAVLGKKLELHSIVPEGCQLTLHGVGSQQLRPITIRVSAAAVGEQQQQATRGAHDRRAAAPKVDVVTGQPSANAEGEDQLWRHALDEALLGHNFLAMISDTDFKVMALVILPRHLFPDNGPALAMGRIFISSVDRSSPQAEPYWCANDLVCAVANSPALIDGIPGGPPILLSSSQAQRIRCAHVAAAVVLMGGDTTPSIHGLTEELGLKLAVTWAWFTGSLVETFEHQASGLEAFRLCPEAVRRLHKIWYLFRKMPTIHKLLKFNSARQRDAQRSWLDGLSLEQLAAAVLLKVAAPVGVPGQPVRSTANLKVIITLSNARLLQWTLAPQPDEALFNSREGLKAVEGKPMGPWTTQVDWEVPKSGKQPRRPAAATTAAVPKLAATELFGKYKNDLSGVNALPSKPQNDRRNLLVGQLMARGADASTCVGNWQVLKKTLLAVLRSEVPADGGVGGPSASAPAPASVVAPSATRAAGGSSAPLPESIAPALVQLSGDQVMVDASATSDDDDDDMADAESSEEEDTENAPDQQPEARQMFFCCTDEKKAGGYWWCPGCSKCFHVACNAAATKSDGSPLDGTNYMCVPCHTLILGSSSSTSARTSRRTRQRVA